jgi:hypothetical protein
MPELGGRELAEAMTALHPKTRVLFVSGYTEDQLLARQVRATLAAARPSVHDAQQLGDA